MQIQFKINRNTLNFVNFFTSANLTDENENEELSRVDALECEIDKEYTLFDLNSFDGVQRRMEYAAKNGILFAQLGNTTPYITPSIE